MIVIVKTRFHLIFYKSKLLAMKQFSLLCMAAAILLSACNNNKKTADATKEEKVVVSAETAEKQKLEAEMKKQVEELQKLAPLSLDELKNLLPEEIMTAKKENFQVTSATGAGFAHAEYNINDSTEIQVNIYDCGGPGGAGIYNMQFAGMLNIQSETSDGYLKTIDFKGGKAFEQCDKDDNKCTLTYFDGKRFLISIEGHNVHPDGLKEAAGQVRI